VYIYPYTDPEGENDGIVSLEKSRNKQFPYQKPGEHEADDRLEPGPSCKEEEQQNDNNCQKRDEYVILTIDTFFFE